MTENDSDQHQKNLITQPDPVLSQSSTIQNHNTIMPIPIRRLGKVRKQPDYLKD